MSQITGQEEGVEGSRKSDIIQYVQHMLTAFLTHGYLG